MSEMPADQGGECTRGEYTRSECTRGPAAMRGVGEERHPESGFHARGQTHPEKPAT